MPTAKSSMRAASTLTRLAALTTLSRNAGEGELGGRDRQIVDQPRLAEPGGGEDASGPVEDRERRQLDGVADGEIVDRIEARLGKLAPAPGEGGLDRSAAPTDLVGDDLQHVEDRHRAGALVGREIAVARRQSEAVGPAHRRHALDADGQ